jgi:hypothetical protein
MALSSLLQLYNFCTYIFLLLSFSLLFLLVCFRVAPLPDFVQMYYLQILDGANNYEFLESIAVDWSKIQLETCCLNLLSNLGKFDQQKFAVCKQKSEV